YEETGNFFPAPEDTFALGGEDDAVIDPPAFAAPEAPEHTQSRGGAPTRAPTAALLAIAAPLDMPLPRHATGAHEPLSESESALSSAWASTPPASAPSPHAAQTGAPTAGEAALGAVWSRPTPPAMASERPATATATDAHPLGE